MFFYRSEPFSNSTVVSKKKTNVLTKFHEDWTKNVTSRVDNYVLTKFYDDWAKRVTSRVYTRNPARPPEGHGFQQTGTIFELNQHIIKTNILTKLHEEWASNVTSTVFTSFELDRTRNVASRVYTRQNFDDGRTTDDGQKAIPKAHHQHVVLGWAEKA
ncbi:hypothetical protein DPMN_123967 [Dreissena polymorpha]|uniref:Uncharacterized protein n=1 Tax=Dreissena polymorpha TaxID=45954 RepID=A0A9D4GVI1_DREPO|nr:hypothetical protein DPMN_123967 [Dreissena polymorpha]